MTPYLKTYALAAAIAVRRLKVFGISPIDRGKYAIKSANLAVCFLGFSTNREVVSFYKSAEIGVLASLFDLVSDGLKYDARARHHFRGIVEDILAVEEATILLSLLDRKASGSLGVSGLDRGVDAFRVAVNHLESQLLWHPDALYRVGILCQIVDDVLDWKSDFRRSEINFLKYGDYERHLRMLTCWDFRGEFKASVYPRVLFGVIEKAQRISEQILSGQLRVVFST